MEILVTIPAKPHQKEKLLAACPEGVFHWVPAAQVSDELLAKVEVVLGNLPVDRLAKAEKLQWMQLNSAGSDAYAAALPPQVRLTNATGAYGLAISEVMLGMTLVLQKHFALYRDNQNKALWKDEGEVTSIWNSTTLVVGLGDIGGEYAQKMHLLGSRVLGIRRHVTDCPEYLDGLYTLEQLDELLPQADIVALALPNSAATRSLMDAARLAKMKPGSILLNVGRGSAVDSDALNDALQNGPVAGAALDVTDPEPLPAGHPLWQRKNCIITPHVAGDFHLPETLERIVGIMARNLESFVQGQPLENEVDRKSGYRRFKA